MTKKLQEEEEKKEAMKGTTHYTPEQEQNLVEWWRDNEFLFNMTLNDHWDTGLIDRSMRVKPKSLVVHLKTSPIGSTVFAQNSAIY